MWRNVVALMEHHWGEVNQSRLAREAGIGKATTDSLKNKDAHIAKTNTIASIAKVFKVPAWQLLYPGFDPVRPPQVLPFSEAAITLAKAVDAIEDDADRAEFYAMSLRLARFGTRRADAASGPAPAPVQPASTKRSRHR